MTCREKLKLEHPELIDNRYSGGCFECPCDYGYLPGPYCLEAIRAARTSVAEKDDISFNDMCRKCWDMEVEEEK